MSPLACAYQARRVAIVNGPLLTGSAGIGAATSGPTSIIEYRGDTRLQNMEQIELDAQRSKIATDVRKLVEKYRAIFEWNIPDVDQAAADRLILKAIRDVLGDIEKDLQA